MKIYRNPKYINTSESFSNYLFIGQNQSIIIPYIGIDLIDNNPIIKKRGFVDFSYFIFIQFESCCLSEDNHTIKLNSNQDVSLNSVITEHIMFGGFNANFGKEIEIVCKETSLYIPDTAKFGDYPCPFVPLDTPNYSRNMDLDEVDSFFNLKYVPLPIKQILGNNYFSLSINNLCKMQG